MSNVFAIWLEILAYLFFARALLFSTTAYYYLKDVENYDLGMLLRDVKTATVIGTMAHVAGSMLMML